MSDWLEDSTVKSDPADAIDVDGEAGSAGEEAAGGLKVVGAAWAGTEGRELDGVAALAWLGRAAAMVEVLGCGSGPTSLAGSGSRKALRKPVSDWLKPGPVDAIDVDGEADGAGEAELSVEEAEVVGVGGGKAAAELGPEDGVDAETKTRRTRLRRNKTNTAPASGNSASDAAATARDLTPPRSVM